MASRKGQVINRGIAGSLLVGFLALSIPVAQAGPGEVNSVNHGQDIQGGTYFNTAGSRTSFTNEGGSLWLHSGDTLRALEVGSDNKVNGNGGSVYMKADLVRVDGNIDVSALRHNVGYLGNGGKFDVDAKVMFQNGNIFANGANGGLINYNVGNLTMGSNAKTTAQGFGGDGGAVTINSTGIVDIRQGALIDTSGKVLGTIDTNVISIEGSAVNNQGTLRANGVAAVDFKADNGDEAVFAANPQLANIPVPPPISPGSGSHDTATMKNILFATPGAADFRGGTIRLVATGQSANTSQASVINASTALTSQEKSDLNSRNGQVAQFSDGDVLQRGTLQANGDLSKNGGTIIVAANRNAINGGVIQANGANSINGIFDANGNGGNGGNGGTIALTAMNTVSNTGVIQANGGNGAQAQTFNLVTANGADANLTVTAHGGNGGQGGLIGLNAVNHTNSGSIQALGGIGGNGAAANTFDTETATASNPNPIARATSTAGQGGTGGMGGLVAFTGENNPTGNGSVNVNGGQGGRGGNAWADTKATSNTGVPSGVATANAGAGGNGGASGTVLAVNPGTFTSTQVLNAKAGGQGNSGSGSFRTVNVQNGTSTTSTGSNPSVAGSVTSGNNTAVLATRKNEFLHHADVDLLFGQTNGAGTLNTTLSGRLNDSLIRTVDNAAGSSGANNQALGIAEGSSNFVVSNTAAQSLNNDLVNSNINPLFFNLNTLTILNNGNIDNNMLWTPGVHLVGEGFHDMTFSLGGGHISWLSKGNITNNQIVITRGLWSGGSTNLAATQDILNNNDFINIGPNKALISGFNIAGPLYEMSHAGSLIMKAGRDITNSSTGKMESNLIFFDIHPPLNQNPPIDWPKFLNGAQIGANVSLIAGRNFLNQGRIQADALTYRNGALGAANPALTQGGTVNIVAKTGTFTNSGIITADGNAFFSPNESDGPRFTTNTFPATTSFAGTVSTP